MKKRSKGITILANLIIILCLMLLSINPKFYFDFYKKPFGMILYVLIAVFSLFEIILAFNVLALKEWSRKYLVILNIIYIILLFVSRFLQNENFYLNFGLRKPHLITVLFSYGIYIFWYLLLIFFFTRPKVREQFKNN